jgi:citrate lyase subunit beta / citryl-CoA lyase
MAVASRPRRSVLFMPGSNARALEKARGLKADALIFDLEDAVAPEAKQMARAQIDAALARGGYGKRETVLRVNALTTPWGRDDLQAAARMPVAAVLLPKVESGAEVRRAEAVLDDAGASPALALWCMIETPRAVLHAEDIAASTPRLVALLMGAEDLAKDLRAHPAADRLALLPAFGLCILAARAYGLSVLDAIHRDINDDEGFLAACRQARELGFDGKTLIHPRTIEAANAAFAPSPAELDWARRVIAAHHAAAAGQGVLTLDGKLIEKLHVEEAERLLALAAVIAELERG